MSFQSVIDYAEQISVIRRPIVAQTISRSAVVRTVSRGNNTWRFEVKMPNGMRWTDSRQIITQLENLDRLQTSTISFDNPGHDWFLTYQGDLVDTGNIVVNVPTSGSSVTITSGATGLSAGQFRFRAGDIIQLGNSGKCYTVTQDVAHDGTVINLHRPLIDETPGAATLNVGEDCVFTVRCIQFPQWTIFARNQVSWDGSFIFQEVI